jgi:hypothetical protein
MYCRFPSEKKHEHQEPKLFVIGIWSPWNYGEICYIIYMHIMSSCN